MVVGDMTTITVLLDHDSADDREEIDEIEFEFCALQSGPIRVKTIVLVSKTPIYELELPGRRVFLRKESVPSS